jgi:hypothetical protein
LINFFFEMISFLTIHMLAPVVDFKFFHLPSLLTPHSTCFLLPATSNQRFLSLYSSILKLHYSRFDVFSFLWRWRFSMLLSLFSLFHVEDYLFIRSLRLLSISHSCNYSLGCSFFLLLEWRLKLLVFCNIHWYLSWVSRQSMILIEFACLCHNYQCNASLVFKMATHFFFTKFAIRCPYILLKQWIPTYPFW